MLVDTMQIGECRRGMDIESGGIPKRDFYCPTCQKVTSHTRQYNHNAGPEGDEWRCDECLFTNCSVNADGTPVVKEQIVG